MLIAAVIVIIAMVIWPLIFNLVRFVGYDYIVSDYSIRASDVIGYFLQAFLAVAIGSFVLNERK